MFRLLQFGEEGQLIELQYTGERENLMNILDFVGEGKFRYSLGELSILTRNNFIHVNIGDSIVRFVETQQVDVFPQMLIESQIEVVADPFVLPETEEETEEEIEEIKGDE